MAKARADPVTVAVARTRPAYRLAKRGMDIAGSVVGIVVTTPIMLGVAAAIRLESPGPILFRQERIGLGGRPFTVYKFRTMYANADEEAHRRYVQKLLRPDASSGAAHRQTGEVAAAGDEQASGETWVPIELDPRVTRIGRLLRRTHLDEVPQLLNILRGEMSIVGPRPPIPYEVELYEPWQLRRLSVTPGLTGLWQVRGWGKLSFEEGVALDLEYVDQRSFMGDVRIVLRTLWQIVTGRQF